MQLPENILALIEKYQSGTINTNEQQHLDEWYHSFNDEEPVINSRANDTPQQLNERLKIRLQQTILEQKNNVIPMRRRWRLPAAAAAVALIILASATFLFFSSNYPQQQLAAVKQVKKKPKTDFAPGGNKAVLTLADGSAIVLDSAVNGTISNQGKIKVVKLDNGLLAYSINGQQVTENDAAFFNTISTPRGGQYQVTLSDGTRVWLNAASSIRFPVMFAGKERKVEKTGEAYFVVAKNKQMPFKVKANSSEIEVLGTHFNVNAYNDEAATRTTLLEGSVKIKKDNYSALLVPGQQSQVNKNGEIKVVNNADIEEVVAWKDGLFILKKADIPSVLRQIARWYDVDIVYKGNVPPGRITGDMPRNMKLSKMLEVMELVGVHFKIEDNKVLVEP
ncbi:MAG: FecR domain-containing protein [Aquabacterium sp.]|nr:FecR domain-containing protein [Ferruginibacter sp.]